MKEASSNAIAITHSVSGDVAKDAGENILSDLILHGTYKTTHIDVGANKDVTYYAIQEDKFYRVATSLSARPYRAYITNNGSASAAKELYMLNFGDETTGVLSVEGELVDMDKAEFYSLSGVKLSAPQKGINIVKMKNGETKKMRF